MEFLRDEVNGSAATLSSPTPSGEAQAYIVQTDSSGFFNNLKGWGNAIWDLWVHNGGAAPIEMARLGAAPQPETPLAVDPPSGVKASYNTKQKRVTVTWTAPSSGANGYYVYRSTTPGGGYAKLATVAGGTTSYADSAITSGTYYYVVTTYKADKLGVEYESAYSNEASVRIK